MFKRSFLILAVASAAAAGLAPRAHAGVKVWEDGDKWVELGGRLQMQYLYITEDPREGEGGSESTIFFRRLRPYIAGSVTKNWWGKFQWDMGKSLDGDEVAVKDAYMQYIGFKNHVIFIGNSKTVFSREFLASSKRQQTVERWFVGQHNFGSPDRMLGFRVDGHSSNKKFEYKFNIGGENFDPDNRRMDFDTPANDTGDWTMGYVGAGRLSYYPLGAIKRDQGDFDRGSFKYAIEGAAFYWTESDNRADYTDIDENGNRICNSSSKCDLDNATGWELSGGVRGRGLSVDLEYNEIAGELQARSFSDDEGNLIPLNSGMYINGETTIKKWQLEGGYMLPNIPIELVYKRDSMDADGYETAWYANDFGLNYFFNKHKAKVQFVFRDESNVNGADGDNRQQVIMQWQFVF
jgi:phosphate-selective porin OprO/OprP